MLLNFLKASRPLNQTIYNYINITVSIFHQAHTTPSYSFHTICLQTLCSLESPKRPLGTLCLSVQNVHAHDSQTDKRKINVCKISPF